MSNEVCENCGRQIGKLETPYVLNKKSEEYVVCKECYYRCKEPDETLSKSTRKIIKGKQQHSAKPDVQPIEQTGKRWKISILLGCISMFVSIPLFFVGIPYSGIGILLLLIGFILYVTGRVGAWWYHG